LVIFILQIFFDTFVSVFGIFERGFDFVPPIQEGLNFFQGNIYKKFIVGEESPLLSSFDSFNRYRSEVSKIYFNGRLTNKYQYHMCYFNPTNQIYRHVIYSDIVIGKYIIPYQNYIGLSWQGHLCLSGLVFLGGLLVGGSLIR